MEEYIVKDTIYKVAIEDGELLLHKAYDTVHIFNRLGFGMLKYWSDGNHTIHNICTDMAGVDFLHNEVGLGVVERDCITTHEHEIYLGWMADRLEQDFESNQ